jgi:hypothetical protein
MFSKCRDTCCRQRVKAELFPELLGLVVGDISPSDERQEPAEVAASDVSKVVAAAEMAPTFNDLSFSTVMEYAMTNPGCDNCMKPCLSQATFVVFSWSLLKYNPSQLHVPYLSVAYQTAT